jgi:hypothetical protein
MNLVDCVVVEVLGTPIETHGMWKLPVLYNSWGHVSDTFIYAKSEEEALNIKAGYEFVQ